MIRVLCPVTVSRRPWRRPTGRIFVNDNTRRKNRQNKERKNAYEDLQLPCHIHLSIYHTARKHPHPKGSGSLFILAAPRTCYLSQPGPDCKALFAPIPFPAQIRRAASEQDTAKKDGIGKIRGRDNKKPNQAGGRGRWGFGVPSGLLGYLQTKLHKSCQRKGPRIRAETGVSHHNWQIQWN